MDYLKRFYDNTITHVQTLLGYLIDPVGTNQVVLDSDYCFDRLYQRPSTC